MSLSENAEPVAVVMAAGKSTRMKSDLPKVLHPLCGQPLLAYVLAALEEAGIRRKIVVVGYRSELVREQFQHEAGVEFVEQTEQRGTGHAVLVTESVLGGHQGPVVVLAGDMPLVRSEMIRQMIDRLVETNSAALLATAVVSNPFGLGRIVRNEDGEFVRIVEQRDASPEEAALREINPSFYAFDGSLLFDALKQVGSNNAQGEYYLTDVPGILREAGKAVRADILADEIDAYGINDRRQLAQVHELMQRRIQDKLMLDGVTIVDPRSTYVDARAKIGRDTVIRPFTMIEGPCEIGPSCLIGPFTHLRPYTTLADDVRIGAFVQVVRSTIGAGSQAIHLAYLGDATLGEKVTVGAGVITANFDREIKNPTTVESGAFLGSGSVLVAPVRIGADATVGAGAVVTKHHDVRPGETVAGVPARPMKRE
jgi:bifunctional UDP-N-acetylglucosamine pyrophosphorylase / glucosamine-1-phosphate N-acetyltransferase